MGRFSYVRPCSPLKNTSSQRKLFSCRLCEFIPQFDSIRVASGSGIGLVAGVRKSISMTSSVFTTAFPAPSEVMSFQQSVVKWFQDEGADYPWRRTSDPYAILVSEMMLQQTRIATVLERKYFERWMRDFPTTGALANAPEEKVLKAWEGLGYYNRARNLQKAARVVESEHAGKFPETLERILRLPGIGRYTAGAVASFAFERKAPIVDGNILRVLSRILLWRNQSMFPLFSENSGSGRRPSRLKRK